MSVAGEIYYRLCSWRAGHSCARLVARAAQRFGVAPRDFAPILALDLDHAALKGLLQLWPRIHWSPGDGMMPVDQLLAIYRLAVNGQVSGDTVELGAWVGLTTCYLATACRVRGEGKVYAVDTFAGTREGDTTYQSVGRFGGSTFDAFTDQVRRAGVSDLVEPLVGLTTEVCESYSGKAIRLLLIDADHSFEGVRADFELWSPYVAPGGLIVFHDYLMHDVARFVDAYVRRNPDYDMLPGEVVPNVIAVTKKAGTVACLPHDETASAPACASCQKVIV
jgi:predicted O-methyltransferase YrrM